MLAETPAESRNKGDAADLTPAIAAGSFGVALSRVEFTVPHTQTADDSIDLANSSVNDDADIAHLAAEHRRAATAAASIGGANDGGDVDDVIATAAASANRPTLPDDEVKRAHRLFATELRRIERADGVRDALRYGRRHAASPTLASAFDAVAFDTSVLRCRMYVELADVARRHVPLPQL